MDMATVVQYILQTAATLLLLLTTGIASWALKEVYRLRGEMEALKARVESESKQSTREFDRFQGWLSEVVHKLDQLIARRCDNCTGKADGR